MEEGPPAKRVARVGGSEGSDGVMDMVGEAVFTATGSVPLFKSCDAMDAEEEEALWDDDEEAHELSEEERIEMMAYLEAELMRDLETEEQELAVQAEGHLRVEEGAMQHDVEGYLSRGNDGLLCPVCRLHNISFRNHGLVCPCGVRINTQTDHVDESFLRHQLSALVEHHSGQCRAQPFFCVQNQFGIEGLYMLCNDCDALELVI